MKSRIEFRPNLIEMTFVFVSSALLLRLSIARSIFPNESGLQHVSPIPCAKTTKSCFCFSRCPETEQNGRRQRRRRPRSARQKRVFVFIVKHITRSLFDTCDAFRCILRGKSAYTFSPFLNRKYAHTRTLKETRTCAKNTNNERGTDQNQRSFRAQQCF